MDSRIVVGKRRDIQDGETLQPGEYGKYEGIWFCCAPTTIPPMFHGNLNSHEVVEHEDGTITVSPSILISHWTGKQWHGFLERGVWRKV
jgi:hypothetical protein